MLSAVRLRVEGAAVTDRMADADDGRLTRYEISARAVVVHAAAACTPPVGMIVRQPRREPGARYRLRARAPALAGRPGRTHPRTEARASGAARINPLRHSAPRSEPARPRPGQAAPAPPPRSVLADDGRPPTM